LRLSRLYQLMLPQLKSPATMLGPVTSRSALSLIDNIRHGVIAWGPINYYCTASCTRKVDVNATHFEITVIRQSYFSGH